MARIKSTLVPVPRTLGFAVFAPVGA